MKDTDGTLIHSQVPERTLAVPTPPSSTTSRMDALRRPLRQGTMMAGSAAVSCAGWVHFASLDFGPSAFLGIGAGVAGAMLPLYLLNSIIENQMNRSTSMLQSGLAKLSGRKSIATAAASMIESEWNRSTITTQRWSSKGFGREPRMMRIALPSGAMVTVLHGHDERPLVVLNAKDESTYDIDPKKALGMAGSAKVLKTIERIQTERLCFLLDVPQGQSPMALSRILAEALPCESRDTDISDGGLQHRSDSRMHTVEIRHLSSIGIVVTSIRPKHGTEHSEVFVEAPGIGTMLLPGEGFSSVMARRRETEMQVAFGAATIRVVTVPVFLGNARATRIADLARQALADDPALTDASGSPIRSLIEDHMPRLLSVHRENARTARTSDISEIDATLDRGLDVVARALGDAIDGLADRKLDELRTEVRFLESRHPEAAASPNVRAMD